MKRQVLRAALATCVIAIAAGGVGSAQAATAPCGTSTATNYTHVIWIMMENHSYGDIIGNTAQAPYINSLAGECGLATNYHNISHPSLPNYIAATSGLPLASLKPFTNDCGPSHKCSTSAPSIMSQTSSWKAYEESMPSNCYRKNRGEYAVRHNPGPYYTSLTSCATNDVPYTRLAGDLAGGNLPAFSFITPNLIDDMHDGTIAQGDSWLAANVPAVLGSPEYQAGNVAIFITWDEGGGGTSNDCATNTTDIGVTWRRW
ncbi:MAG TPA: alkaline phosphatase family protein [Solirubrobacteraceae bacterium]|nr:alkaline phosphatase family protein [Solirubrobacteraceae bacterium]